MPENRYEKFNNYLFNSIKGSRQSITAFNDGEKSKGTLLVQVSTANGAIPIAGAEVQIAKDSGDLIKTLYTDESGKTEKIELTAPNSEISQLPGNVKPFSTYTVVVKKPGYYTERFVNLSVFDDTLSIQNADMKPLGANSKDGDTITIDEGGNELWQ